MSLSADTLLQASRLWQMGYRTFDLVQTDRRGRIFCEQRGLKFETPIQLYDAIGEALMEAGPQGHSVEFLIQAS